jgi:hypothetical protein
MRVGGSVIYWSLGSICVLFNVHISINIICNIVIINNVDMECLVI